MPSEDARHVDRRTVLKAMTATAVAGVGAAGTASATHIQEGQLVYVDTTVDVAASEDPCESTPGPVYEPGDVGVAASIGNCGRNPRRVLFDPAAGQSQSESGWLRDEYLAPCDGTADCSLF